MLPLGPESPLSSEKQSEVWTHDQTQSPSSGSGRKLKFRASCCPAHGSGHSGRGAPGVTSHLQFLMFGAQKAGARHGQVQPEHAEKQQAADGPWGRHGFPGWRQMDLEERGSLGRLERWQRGSALDPCTWADCCLEQLSPRSAICPPPQVGACGLLPKTVLSGAVAWQWDCPHPSSPTLRTLCQVSGGGVRKANWSGPRRHGGTGAAPKSSWQQLGGLGPCDLPMFRRACGCAAIAMS